MESSKVEEKVGVQFESDVENTGSSSSSNRGSYGLPVPEMKLTLFALQLAVLEKAATGVGALGFIWATVVILGGFAITLDKSDFWFVTVILLIEGTRIFSRSKELEWQHQATRSFTDAGINGLRALGSYCRPVEQHRRPQNLQARASCGRTASRTWESSDVPILPYARWLFLSRNISKLLYWLQLASAASCIVLSSTKLIKHNYGRVSKGDDDQRNREAALTIFYSLAMAEALLFLVERACWEWKIMYHKLLEQVNGECELGPSGTVWIRRFFYDAYSRCINGSIFDGLKMDMVSFAIDLFSSNSPEEQLIGTRILRQFAKNLKYSGDALQKIGTNTTTIERLLDMLNWRDAQEQEIRLAAAEIVSKLAAKRQNSLRIAGAPGAVESIASLLQMDEITGDDQSVSLRLNRRSWRLHHLGLQILKRLARDRDNGEKIASTRDLLPTIIHLTSTRDEEWNGGALTPHRLLALKRCLQVVKTLASTAGRIGKRLRGQISEIVFTISNIRCILRHAEKHPILQKLCIEILVHLAIEDGAKESIGATGGIMRELMHIFCGEQTNYHDQVRIVAGEALAALVSGSESNCDRILKMNPATMLTGALDVPFLRLSAATVLRYLCAFNEADSFLSLNQLTVSASIAQIGIVSGDERTQEVMLGLAAELFKSRNSEESRSVIEINGNKLEELGNSIIQILRKSMHPSIRVPRTRRFAIEMTIRMMLDAPESIHVFKNLGLEKELMCILETTSEIENFIVFSSRSVGLIRHKTTIAALVQCALRLLLVT